MVGGISLTGWLLKYAFNIFSIIEWLERQLTCQFVLNYSWIAGVQYDCACATASGNE